MSRFCSNLARPHPTTVSSSFTFVPVHKDPEDEHVSSLREILASAQEVLVVTGAGISTESGLPDYRSEGVGLYARTERRPMRHMTFLKSESARKSYWARNFVGWQRWSSAHPNDAHVALAKWERNKNVTPQLSHIVTQNVDQLHFKAGSSRVLELHGSSSVVGCLNCSYVTPRLSLQSVLSNLNPNLAARPTEDVVRPDGDVELSTEDVANFVLATCPKCHSNMLKPKVVFFGDNIPKERVAAVRSLVTHSQVLLVIGSSLDVFSGYRIVLQAKEEGKKVALINIGNTRADTLADVKVTARAGAVLEQIIPQLHS